MGKNLKDSLRIIKARAKAIRQRREAPELLDDLVESGAVTKGKVEKKPVRDVESDTTGSGAESVLVRFKEGEPGPIEAIEPGEDRTIGGETFYLVRPAGEAVDPTAPAEAEAFGRLGGWPDYVVPKVYGARRMVEPPVPPPFDKETVCFLDIETCGLSPTTYLFLIGLMFWEQGRFVCDLVFARNYAEERAVLQYVRKTMSRFDTVVSYNGNSFDLPFIETRMSANRVEPLAPFASVDLLYTARRVFRGILPNNRLGTVERHIRGIKRTGDIPGRYIPDAYHDYVRSGDARAMKNVLYHNRMDLFTMAILINRLASNEPSSR
jgi:uncharacterized protein YprB with RNaseH-like and TPR domain